MTPEWATPVDVDQEAHAATRSAAGIIGSEGSPGEGSGLLAATEVETDECDSTSTTVF